MPLKVFLILLVAIIVTAAGEMLTKAGLERVKKTYLFDVESDLAGELDTQQVPAWLREQLETCCPPLSSQAQVQVDQAGEAWIVVDGDTQYAIQRDDDVLKVYQVEPFAFKWPILWRTFTNWMVLLGFVLIFGAAVLWLVVISRVNLSLAYPILALGYLVTVIASWLILKEPLTWQKVVGSIVICVGVGLVAWSGK